MQHVGGHEGAQDVTPHMAPHFFDPWLDLTVGKKRLL